MYCYLKTQYVTCINFFFSPKHFLLWRGAVDASAFLRLQHCVLTQSPHIYCRPQTREVISPVTSYSTGKAEVVDQRWGQWP